MKSPSVKRNFLFNLIYQIFVFITPIVTTPYVSRVLSADGIGEYSYSVSIVTYFSLFGTFGLSTYGQLEIAKNRENMPLVGKIIRDIFIIRCITMLVSIIVYCLTVIHSNENKTIYLILLLGLIGIVFDFTFVYQGLELFDVLAIRNLIVKTSGIILIFLAVK